MKRYLLHLYCLLAILTGAFTASATHIFGGELLYTHLTGSTYQVQLVLYADCQGSTAALQTLYTGTPRIDIYQNNTFVSNILLNGSAGNGAEVTPLCPSQAGQSSCSNVNNPLPGIRKFVYTGNTNFTPANWKLVFNGGSQPNINPGRSSNITNIANPGNSIMSLEATLNNTQGENSSPQYTSIPTPFFCVNVTQQYNQGAVDPDGDVLNFSLVPGIVNGGSVVYVSSYTATQPMSTTANGFSFNNINGQMSFTPDIQQRPLIVNKVEEYKNGVLVGTSMREMTFIVVNTCNNNPPSGNIGSNVNAGVLSGGNVLNICVGTPGVAFSINPIDPDGDTITISSTSAPAGAVVNILNNSTANPIVNFSWNTTSVPVGNYTFYLTYKDNGCPLSSQQTQAYTISVVPLYTINAQVLYPTECDHKAYVRFNVANGLVPRKIQLLQGSTVVKTYIDSTGIITDSLDAGTYTALMSFAAGTTQCVTTKTLVIGDSGVYPHSAVITTPVYYCRGDQPSALLATPSPSVATIKWYDATGNPLSAAPTPSTATPGVYSWLVNQKYKTCESVKDTVKVFVTERPVAAFTIPPGVCDNDTATIIFTGTAGDSAIYNWTWDGPQKLTGTGAGPYRAWWPNPGNKTITLQVTENNCSSAVISQTIQVKQTPEAAFTVRNICEYDSTLVYYTAGNQLPNTAYFWDFGAGAQPFINSGIGPHYIHWNTPGDKSVLLQTSLEGCYDSVRKTISVYPQPDVRILNTPGTLCMGDKIYLRTEVSKGETFNYTWTPKGTVFKDADSGYFTYVLQPTTYKVTVRNEYGCNNSDSITYTSIEPCCNFSYPSAFTPNGDGKNDHFSIITYGNDDEYELRIFDRWGQQMFLSYDQHDSWDGTHNGKPCEIGTYFYMFKARCITGRTEQQKGEIMLIR